MNTTGKIILGIIVIILVAVVGWFISYYPAISPKAAPEENTQTNTELPITEEPQITPAPFGPDAVSAIKAYAANQFRVSESTLVVVSTTQKEWETTCFDLNIDDDSCINTPTSGYEVVLEIEEQQITYRANDEGTSVRIVKN
ncbi:MAG TPA: hypothetical protein VLF20_06545 [Patescibacteria group bacterium]|nr:hypothetical protein [Patescibacteria group bacterium]